MLPSGVNDVKPRISYPVLLFFNATVFFLYTKFKMFNRSSEQGGARNQTDIFSQKSVCDLFRQSCTGANDGYIFQPHHGGKISVN